MRTGEQYDPMHPLVGLGPSFGAKSQNLVSFRCVPPTEMLGL